MDHYLFLLGPYDSTVVGPFASRLGAVWERKALKKTWKYDIHIWNQIEYDANVAEFGPIEVVAPKEYRS